MSPATFLLLGIALPLWGSSQGSMEAQGFSVMPGDGDQKGVAMRRRDAAPRLGAVDVLASLRATHLDALMLQTKCSPEQLADALKTVTYCKEMKGEYLCEPSEPTNPFVARVCGRSIMLWMEGDPETLRQVNLGCQLAQSMYKEAQEAKPDAGRRP
jgi:hypothetical protein